MSLVTTSHCVNISLKERKVPMHQVQLSRERGTPWVITPSTSWINLAKDLLVLSTEAKKGPVAKQSRWKKLKSKKEIKVLIYFLSGNIEKWLLICCSKQLICWSLSGAVAFAEIKNLEKLPHHPNLVQYKGYHFHNESFWLYMEFCDMGDISEYYKKYYPAKIPLAHQMHFMYQVS